MISEQQAPPNAANVQSREKRSGWVYHISTKIMLVVLACSMLLTAILGSFLLSLGAQFGLLTMNQTDFCHTLFEEIAWLQLEAEYDFYNTVDLLEEINDDTIRQFAHTMHTRTPTDLYVKVCTAEDGRELFNNIPDDLALDWTETRTTTIHYYGKYAEGDIASEMPSATAIRRFEITLAVPETKTAGSLYATISSIGRTLHRLRWIILLATVVSAMLVIGLFAFLLMVSGRQVDGSVRPNTVDLLPYDIFLLFYGLIVFLQVEISVELSYSSFEFGAIALVAVFLLVDMPLLVLLFTSTATRCKCGTIVTNTVIFRLLRGLWFVLRWIWRVPVCGFAGLISQTVEAIPVVWQGLFGMATVSLSSLIILIGTNTFEKLFVFWLIFQLILIPIGCYFAVTLARLQESTQRLSNGEINYRVDTKGLISPLRRHAEALNNIQTGINRAVEERMRSERLRTELITNVSHDIKTPLTSIINYIDLLDKELEDVELPDSAGSYLEVIERQSLRLKKLIEDLIEASKASSGAIAVTPAPCQVSVLLTQALAEYQEKLDAVALETVIRLPENEPTILADGRLLWRVFDNLLSNVSKYSLHGTRLYIDMDILPASERENTPRQLRLTFRNISAHPLNISPDELMERFVRGDVSRHAEGNGLGLSIAHCLLELQHGSLNLEIDGDLFKAIILLPIDTTSVPKK